MSDSEKILESIITIIQNSKYDDSQESTICYMRNGIVHETADSMPNTELEVIAGTDLCKGVDCCDCLFRPENNADKLIESLIPLAQMADLITPSK